MYLEPSLCNDEKGTISLNVTGWNVSLHKLIRLKLLKLSWPKCMETSLTLSTAQPKLNQFRRNGSRWNTERSTWNSGEQLVPKESTAQTMVRADNMVKLSCHPEATEPYGPQHVAWCYRAGIHLKSHGTVVPLGGVNTSTICTKECLQTLYQRCWRTNWRYCCFHCCYCCYKKWKDYRHG